MQGKTLKTTGESVDWMNLAQAAYSWQAHLSELLFRRIQGILWKN
jgi:hypothetical protein